MASLLDIGPLSRTVNIRGVDITVSGVSGLALFHLMDGYPEMQKIFTNSGVAVDPETLLRQAPGAVASVVVHATGGGSFSLEERTKCEATFLTLALGEQLELLMPIWELTFPTGVASFKAALEKAGIVTKSGWDRVTPSPGPLNNSSQQDTTQTVSGTTPQE